MRHDGLRAYQALTINKHPGKIRLEPIGVCPNRPEALGPVSENQVLVVLKQHGVVVINITILEG